MPKHKKRRGGEIKKLAEFFRMAGDENRLKILCQLFGRKEVCVSDIAKAGRMSVAIASHHLRVMAGRGLLKPAREGKRICYRPQDIPLAKELRQLVCKYIK